MIKVLTQIKRKGYLWNTSQTLELSYRRKSEESETVTMGIKDKRVQQAKLAKLQKERAEEMKNEVAGLQGRLQRTSQEAKDKLQQEKLVPGGSRASHK